MRFHLALAILCAALLPVAAQQLTPAQMNAKAKAQNVPEIPFDSAPNFLKLPPNLYLGEGIGVATNSKGHIFVYTRSQETRLFEFDQKGVFVREIGEGLYGFVFAHAVRVDKDDNIWAVDEGSNMVIKFNPAGQVVMLLGRRPVRRHRDGHVLPGDQDGVRCSRGNVGFDEQPAVDVLDCRPAQATRIAWGKRVDADLRSGLADRDGGPELPVSIRANDVEPFATRLVHRKARIPGFLDPDPPRRDGLARLRIDEPACKHALACRRAARKKQGGKSRTHRILLANRKANRAEVANVVPRKDSASNLPPLM